MKKLNVAIFAIALAFTISFASSVKAQDTMMGKIGDKVQKTSTKVAKKTWRGTRRVGTTIGSKTWNGSKWVASKSWRGGKWVAVKTVNGTKWVYRKAKRPFTGKPRRNM